MSILLDALRKSEQQKKLGAKPDIHSLEPVSYSRQRPAWIVPAAMVLVLLAAVVGGYATWRIYFHQPSTSSEAVVAAPATGAPEQGTGIAATDTTPATPSETTNRAAPERSPRLDQQPRSPVEALTGSSPYKAASQAATSASETDNTRAPEAKSVATGPSVDTSQSAPESNARRPAAQQARAEPSAEDLAANDPPPARPANPSRPGNAVISYWQLPESARERIPPIKITVLVYDEIPSNRFILSGGKRYQVGDMIANDVRLLNIQRDRAVFRHGAYRFFVTQR